MKGILYKNWVISFERTNKWCWENKIATCKQTNEVEPLPHELIQMDHRAKVKL